MRALEIVQIVWQQSRQGDATHQPNGRLRSLGIVLRYLRLYVQGRIA